MNHDATPDQMRARARWNQRIANSRGLARTTHQTDADHADRAYGEMQDREAGLLDPKDHD